MAEGTCSIDGCEKPVKVKSRQLCGAHDAKRRKYGDPTVQRYGLSKQACIITGCNRPGTQSRGHGWCEMHYRRYQRHGSPFVTSRIVGDDVARFETYIREGKPPAHAAELGSCWLWVGALTPDGYGTMQVRDLPTASAHRWSYRHHVDDLPEGLELDHLCMVVNCVNPWHLDPVPHAENVRRVNARKMHCPQGHPYDEANTRWQRGGKARQCKTCKAAHDARRRLSA